MAAGVALHLDARDMQKLYADLKKAQSALTVELRRGVKAGSAPLVAGMKGRAGFSSRIPGSIRAKPNFSAKNPSVTITAGGSSAPDAGPINNRGRSGKFRHPVYGNRDNWVQQTAHPFMRPAYSEVAAAEAKILKVMDDVARKAGFK